MLILTRRSGEVLRIGDEISITVLQVKGGQIRLGICAPRSVAVHREEVFQRIEVEKETIEAAGEEATPEGPPRRKRTNAGP